MARACKFRQKTPSARSRCGLRRMENAHSWASKAKMTTLSKRATPAQAKVLRIIEGAVLNTADAHKLERDKQLARSIAKRATGTLTAQWPEVLAANSRPPKSGTATDGKCRACERRMHTAKWRARHERTTTSYGARADKYQTAAQGWGPSQFNRRLPLLELWHRLKREMRAVKRSGNQAKIDAHIHLLKMIDKLHRQEVSP